MLAAYLKPTTKPKGFDRKVGSRGAVKPSILIVCEGTKTEPQYFESFKVKSSTIYVRGTGKNTLSVVEEAEKINEKDGPYDQVWCVFDRDSFEPNKFNSAIKAAKHRSFRVAYSNEAFEIWLILHFDYYQTGSNRSDYKRLLSKRLGKKYEKNCPPIYEDLLKRQSIAIRNAEKLLRFHSTPNPEKNNPSTTVHILVKELIKYL